MSTSPVLVASRVQLANRNTFIWSPLLVLGGAFVLTLAVWGIVQGAVADPDGAKYSGAVQAPFWYLLVIGAQAVAFTFPFSQALSITRRDFWLGAMTTFLGFSAIWSVGLWALGLVEKATGGWFMDGSFFTLPLDLTLQGHSVIPAAGSPWYLLLWFLLALLALSVGFAFGTVYKRWGTMGLTISIIAVVAVLVAFIGSAVKWNWWPTLATLFPLEHLVGSISVALGVVIIAASLLSWALVRRLPA